MMSRILTTKLFFEILCLKIIIAKTEPTDPPKNVVVNKVPSEILGRLFFAKNLSVPKIAKLVREMKMK